MGLNAFLKSTTIEIIKRVVKHVCGWFSLSGTVFILFVWLDFSIIRLFFNNTRFDLASCKKKQFYAARVCRRFRYILIYDHVDLNYVNLHKSLCNPVLFLNLKYLKIIMFENYMSVIHISVWIYVYIHYFLRAYIHHIQDNVSRFEKNPSFSIWKKTLILEVPFRFIIFLCFWWRQLCIPSYSKHLNSDWFFDLFSNFYHCFISSLFVFPV